MKIYFKLKDPKANGLTSIQMKFHLQGKKFIYSLGTDKRINPNDWNFETERPKDKKSNLTTRIENLISETEKYFIRQEKLQEPIDKQELKETLNKLSEFKGTKTETKEIEFEDFVEQFIKDIDNGTRVKKKNEQYSKLTVKAYKTHFKKLLEYRDFKRIKKLQFRHFDSKFYNQFRTYIFSKNHSNNYLSNIIKNIKSLLNAAYIDGLHNETAFRDYKKSYSETYKIALSENEVESIMNVDLSKHKSLELSRDIFVIQCKTSLRVSDATRLKPEYIVKDENGKNYIELITKKKPHKLVAIPISTKINPILKKYDYRIPKTNDQKINEDLKEIAKLAGLTDKVEITENKGNIDVIKQVPKYTIITSHTGRRTAATNMYKAKLNPIEIIKMTGHSEVKTLMTYLKVTSKESARIVAENRFFDDAKPLSIAK